jgi:Zn-dependent protease
MSAIFDISLQTLLLRLVAGLIVGTVAGCVAAIVARVLGDRGPVDEKRLTLNPIMHVDLIGLAAGAAFGIGWSQPVALDPARLRGQALGALVVAIATLLALIAVAAAADALQFAAATLEENTAALLARDFLATLTAAGIAWAILNIAPVPPLIGGYVLAAAWPKAHALLWRGRLIVGTVLFVLLALRLPQTVIGPIADMVGRVVGAGR